MYIVQWVAQLEPATQVCPSLLSAVLLTFFGSSLCRSRSQWALDPEIRIFKKIETFITVSPNLKFIGVCLFMHGLNGEMVEFDGEVWLLVTQEHRGVYHGCMCAVVGDSVCRVYEWESDSKPPWFLPSTCIFTYSWLAVVGMQVLRFSWPK